MNINKLLSWITLFFVIFYSCSTTVFATTQYFTVTAYYSPLPDQKYYLKWDYDAERRLNGMWIRWASGRAVFSGMIAAPKNYQFGTKVYLQWLWVWDIQDRGWAIVNAWERWYKHDRLMFGFDMEMRDLEEHLPGEKEPYHDTLLLQVRIQQ